MLAPYSDDPLVSLTIQINNSTWIILIDVKSGKWSWSRFIFSNSSRVLISCSGEKIKVIWRIYIASVHLSLMNEFQIIRQSIMAWRSYVGILPHKNSITHN